MKLELFFSTLIYDFLVMKMYLLCLFTLTQGTDMPSVIEN